MTFEFRADREAHLRVLCEEMGRSVDDFVNEAVLTFMEDYEDGQEIAHASLDQDVLLSAEEVRKQLGLDSSVQNRSAEAA